MLRRLGSTCLSLFWFCGLMTRPALGEDHPKRVLELDSEMIFVDDFSVPNYHAEYHLHSTIYSPRTVDLVITHPGQINYCMKSHTERDSTASAVLGGGGGYVERSISYTVCDRYGKTEGKIETIIKLELGKGGTNVDRDFTLVISQANINDSLDFDIIAAGAKKKKLVPSLDKQRRKFWSGLKQPGVSFDFGGKDSDLSVEAYLQSPFLETFEQAASSDPVVLVPKEAPSFLAKRIIFHRDRRTPALVEFDVEFYSFYNFFLDGSDCLTMATELHNDVKIDTCISKGHKPRLSSATLKLDFGKGRDLTEGEEEVFEIIVVGGRKPRVIAGPDYKVKQSWFLPENYLRLVYSKKH